MTAPSAVRDLARRLGVRSEALRSVVTLEQKGRMKRTLDATAWMSFAATQSIWTQECRFDWRARAGPLGLVSGHDALQGDEGRFDIMALGIIPIARAEHSAALVRGELMRYLAEIPWAPDALLCNTALRWRLDAQGGLIVEAGAGDTAVEVHFTLDAEGRIAGAFAADRPRSASPPILPTPWRGRFSDYRCQAGMWIPFAAEVGWEIDGVERVYWQAGLTRWESR